MWTEPTRTEPSSSLALVLLEKLFASEGNDGFTEKGGAVVGMQRRPGPDNPQWKIPRSEWPLVLRRIGQRETYR